MRVLVTGATGLLGQHVLQELSQVAPEAERCGLARSDGPWPASVTGIRGAVEAPETWAGHPALDGVSVIVHLAAKVAHTRARADATATQRVNVDGTVAMVELAGRLGARLVFVSTSGTVGVFDDPDAWADEQSPYATQRTRRWPYYASKIAAEQRATERAAALGVSLVIVRPPILLSPADPTGRSIRHVTRVLDGHLPGIVHGGIHWVDARAVGDAVVRLALMDDPPSVMNLPGTHTSLRHFVDRVAELGGVRPPRLTLPFPVVHMAARVTHRAGVSIGLPDPVLVEMAHHWWGLRTRHAERVGWAPPEGDETLQETVAWVRGSRG